MDREAARDKLGVPDEFRWVGAFVEVVGFHDLIVSRKA
jgi:hypothetical protein